jgi:hypothetical protein
VSITSGVRSGVRSGLRSGVNPSLSATWDVDASSSKALPSSSDQWSAFRTANSLAIGTPDLLYTCQETSGNLSPSIGALSLTAAGTVSYNNAVAGWSRKFLGTNDGVAGSFGSTNAALPDPASQSITVLALANITGTPAAQRSVIELFTNANVRLRVNTTPRLVVFNNPNSSAVGAASPTTVVRPYWLRYTQGSATHGGSDADKLSPTHVANVGKNLQIGGAFSTPPAMRVGYVAVWYSAVSDAALKACLQAMGFVIPWS